MQERDPVDNRTPMATLLVPCCQLSKLLLQHPYCHLLLMHLYMPWKAFLQDFLEILKQTILNF